MIQYKYTQRFAICNNKSKTTTKTHRNHMQAIGSEQYNTFNFNSFTNVRRMNEVYKKESEKKSNNKQQIQTLTYNM